MDFSLRNGKRAQRDEVVETFVCQRRDSYVNDDPCPREINNDAAGPAALASLVPAVNGDRCVRGIAAAAAAAGQTLTSLLPRRSIVYTRSRLTADSQTEIQMMGGGGGIENAESRRVRLRTRLFARACSRAAVSLVAALTLTLPLSLPPRYRARSTRGRERDEPKLHTGRATVFSVRTRLNMCIR